MAHATATTEKIDGARDRYEHIFVAYGDCGTSGELDRVLEERGVKRLPGAHCYDFLAGRDSYQQMQDDEPGTFYLTDFLAQHFQRLVIEILGIDRHPELLEMYFGLPGANRFRRAYRAGARRGRSARPAFRARVHRHG
jgi:hypothetical protein